MQRDVGSLVLPLTPALDHTGHPQPLSHQLGWQWSCCWGRWPLSTGAGSRHSPSWATLGRLMPRVCQSAEAMVRRSKSLQWMGMGVEVGITRLPHSQEGRDLSSNPDSWEGRHSRLGVLNLQKALGLWWGNCSLALGTVVAKGAGPRAKWAWISTLPLN